MPTLKGHYVNNRYHHGALRDALLQDAQRLLIEQGVEAVTIRELARRAGVSHSAPERHFANRQALLTALAERGFVQLNAALREAVESHPDRFQDRFRAVAGAYVSFAVENSGLLELMFASKADSGHALGAEANRLFSLTSELVGEPVSSPSESGRSPLRLVLASTLQGIAAFAASNRLPPEAVDAVLDEAVALFLPAVTRRPQR